MATAQVTGQVSPAVYKTRVWRSVWVKRFWDDPWTYIPYLYPVSATESAQPTMPTATFAYDFGTIKREDVTTFSAYRPWNFQGFKIAIRGHSVFGFFDIWFGVVGKFGVKIDGTDSSTGVGSGLETFSAYGLEYLLDRRRVSGTYNENLDADGNNEVVGREAIFNQRFTRGQSNAGNRSASRNGDGIYTFSSTDTDEWTNLDILEYVIHFFQTDAPQFRFVGQPEILDQIVERHNLDGLSVLDCMNKLIDRRRGLGWRLLTNGGGVVGIFVYSVLADPISFEEIQIPRNLWQDTLFFDGLIDLQPQVEYSDLNLYDRIVVRGEPIRVCGSFSPLNGTLEPAWSAADETAYEAAEDTERSTDKYRNVFAKFRVPPDWDWSYISLQELILPEPVRQTMALAQTRAGEVFADAENPANVWNLDHKFLREILMEEESGLADAEEDYREPFAVIYRGDTLKWAYTDRLKNEKEKADQLHNLRLTVGNRDLSVTVRGRVNHLLGGAGNGFGEFPAAPSPDTNVPAELNWKNLILTLALETDTIFGVDIKLPGPSESGKTLIIDVPGASFWRIVGGTVKDVTDGDLVYNNNGLAETIRDDSPRLRAIAIASAAWYGMQRAVISYKFIGLAPFHPVGMLIRGAVSSSIGIQRVGTVVTERKWNFLAEDGFGTTQVRTGYGELDAVVVTK